MKTLQKEFLVKQYFYFSVWELLADGENFDQIDDHNQEWQTLRCFRFSFNDFSKFNDKMPVGRSTDYFDAQ